MNKSAIHSNLDGLLPFFLPLVAAVLLQPLLLLLLLLLFATTTFACSFLLCFSEWQHRP